MREEVVEAAEIRELVTRAKQGDLIAFDELVERYTTQIYAVSLRITGSHEEAEDCVQEAFIRAFSALRKFRGEAAFSTWLYRVAVNVANDAARRRRAQPLYSSELADKDPDSEPPDLDKVIRSTQITREPENHLVASQRREVILRAIQSLPEHQRAVVVLCDLQGLTYEEAARILETRVGTIKSRLNRARLALRERLAPYMELLHM